MFGSIYCLFLLAYCGVSYAIYSNYSLHHRIQYVFVKFAVISLQFKVVDYGARLSHAIEL